MDTIPMSGLGLPLAPGMQVPQLAPNTEPLVHDLVASAGAPSASITAPPAQPVASPPQVATDVAAPAQAKPTPSGMSAAPASKKPPPSVGSVMGTYKFQGGNPADKNAWVPLQGDEYLQTLDPTDQAVVKAMVQGRKSWPSGFATKLPYWQQKIQQASRYDPNFDEKVYDIRKKTLADFTSGATSKLLRALNQAPLHTAELAKSYDQLKNWSGPQFLNDLANNALSGMNDTKIQGAQGAFNEARPAVAEELATVYTGKPATVEAARRQEEAFPSGAQPAYSNAALATAAKLMHDRLLTLKTQWGNTFGKIAPPFPIISPVSESAIQSLYQRYNQAPGNNASSVAAPAAPKFINNQVYTDKNGNKARYDNGQWVPVP